MASPFRRDAPVVHFGPRLPKGMRWSQRRFLLWPALMYRVVAPEVQERQLNVLQKAVLGMCRAGITNAQRIGEEDALAGEHRPLQPGGQPAGHLDVQLDVPGDEHHRARFGGHLLSGLEGDYHGGGLTFANRSLHASDPTVAAPGHAAAERARNAPSK